MKIEKEDRRATPEERVKVADRNENDGGTDQKREVVKARAQVAWLAGLGAKRR